MINAKESEDVRAKEEGGADDETKVNPKAGSSSSCRSRLNDPRIVRVSRAFGGKDRHSKVCTVRGLRDRRVRLSVPTAIQLYDLQDRLGLNQPSKAVDWLLNAAKHEIDHLPPLQLPPGANFNQLQSAMLLEAAGTATTSNGVNWPDIIEPPSADHHNAWPKPNNINKDQVVDDDEEDELGKQCHSSYEDQQQAGSVSYAPSSSCCNNNFFFRPTTTSSSNLVHNSQIYTSLIRWDPSSTLSLSQSGSTSQGQADHHQDDFHNFNVHHHFSAASSAPTLVSSVPSSAAPHHQLLLYPPGHHVTHSYFPTSHDIAATQPSAARPFHFIGTTNTLFPTHNHHGRPETNHDSEFHSR